MDVVEVERKLDGSTYASNDRLRRGVIALFEAWSGVEDPDPEAVAVFQALVRGEALPAPEQVQYVWYPLDTVSGPRVGQTVRVALDAMIGIAGTLAMKIAPLRGMEGHVVAVRRGDVIVRFPGSDASAHLPPAVLEFRTS